MFESKDIQEKVSNNVNRVLEKVEAVDISADKKEVA